MPSSQQQTPAADSIRTRFFAPLEEAVATSKHRRKCPAISDESWARGGVLRVLGDFASGRDFLQRGGMSAERSTYFEGLKSNRRTRLIVSASDTVAKSMRTSRSDALAAALPELDGYEVFAGDGHWHGAAAHDARDSEGRKFAVGHLYGLDMRCGALFHIGLAEGKKEHDMAGLKRKGAEALRRGAPKGTKVVYVWDRAAIDLRLWHAWKQSRGVYFVSRTKKGMLTSEGLAPRKWDPEDPQNAGVTGDYLWAGSTTGVSMRVIRYCDPATGLELEFITSITDMAVTPGAIAMLYRMRWDIEKVFDEVKNATGEGKAWASSAEAKSAQAAMICLAHNLLRLLEDHLEMDHDIRNDAEIKRREQRRARQKEKVEKNGGKWPELLDRLARSTKIPLKLIRWLRSLLMPPSSPEDALADLRALYSKL